MSKINEGDFFLNKINCKNYTFMNFDYSDIKFSMEDSGFSHNFGDDYACFALWEEAKPYRDRIRALLSSEFEILLETEIEWSKYHFHDNASRLYERPVYHSIPKIDRKSEHAWKIGDRVFVLFVIKDKKPKYSYAMSISKVIELSNLNTVAVKEQMRNWIFQDTGVKYAVHGTNNIYEFLYQAPLLLGVEMLGRLLNGEKPLISRISKDLEGANGWSSWRDVFEILNLTNNYLVLKEYEESFFVNREDDFSLLTDNYQRVASALGISQSSPDSYRGVIKVKDKETPINIRFVGDKYLNSAWQKDMLNHKFKKQDTYVLRHDFCFFYLLFSCAFEESRITDECILKLDSIASKKYFTWYHSDMLLDKSSIGSVLKGYFQANGYYYEKPIDKSIFRNKDVVRVLPCLNSIVLRESKRSIVKRTIKKALPVFLFSVIKRLNTRLSFARKRLQEVSF